MVSLPMFAKYSRKRVDDIPMERLLVKLKNPQDEKQIRFLKESIEKALDKQGMRDMYEIWSYQDLVKTSQSAEVTL